MSNGQNSDVPCARLLHSKCWRLSHLSHSLLPVFICAGVARHTPMFFISSPQRPLLSFPHSHRPTVKSPFSMPICLSLEYLSPRSEISSYRNFFNEILRNSFL